MSRIGIAFDAELNDVYLEPDGNLAMARDAELVGQHARQRLRMHQGEWFLDKTAGVPWLDEVMGKQYDPTVAEALVKAELVGTDGVRELTGFSVSFEQSTRGLVIGRIDLMTDYDVEVSFS